MNPDLPQQIRTACARVAERAAHVRIQKDRIGPYAATLPLDLIAAPEIDPAHHYLDRGDDTIAFILTLDAINFGSGFFPNLRKRPGMSGYFTIASSLTDYFREKGPFSAQELSGMTATACTRIFDQDPGNEPIGELMELFATALSDLGSYVLGRFSGSFVELVDAAARSASTLIQILSEMPYFRDVESYGGFEVPFYKRAQLTAADLSLAFHNKGRGEFHDLDRLTIFADNLVPHVLRIDGILKYESDLEDRIDSVQLIAAGSNEEIEIRACALHAVELIAAELRASGNQISAMQLDYLLWNRGQQPSYKNARPRHRTRTVFY